MAAFMIFVLLPFLAALLPAALGRQFGQRSVDVMRGVTVVCVADRAEILPQMLSWLTVGN